MSLNIINEIFTDFEQKNQTEIMKNETELIA